MLSVLLEGTLTADPVARVGAKNNAFTTAQMRTAGEDGETVWCSVIAFSAAAAEALAKLTAGDVVAIAGGAALHHWEKQSGEHRVGLRVTAAKVIALPGGSQRRGAANARGAGRDASTEGGAR